MSAVQKFDHSMIEAYLRGRELKFLRDSDGDFVLEWERDETIGCELRMLLAAAGKNKDIYSILVRSNRRIPRQDWERCVSLCNTWNREKRWPKAYVFWLEGDDASGQILLEGQIDLAKGIHSELFADFTETILGTAFQFWKWAHQEHGL
jgi:hypothetical protein